MNIELRKNLQERVVTITGKRLENISIYIDDLFIADKDSCINIGVGQYNVKVELEYTDGTIDVLENQELRVPDKGAKITINYKGFKDIMMASFYNRYFWLGMLLLGLGGLGFGFMVYAINYGDKSGYYEKRGSSIFALRNR